MNNLKRVFKLLTSLACLPIYLLASLVPRSKRIWVFDAWQGKSFSDNPKQLFLYVRDNVDNIKPVWITKSKRLSAALKMSGINSCYYTSPSGIYYQLRAGAAFFTHHQNTEFVSFLFSRNTRLFQLWHGTPLKKIQLDTPEYQKNNASKTKKFLDFIFPWRRNNWAFVVSPSSFISEYLNSAFAGNRVVVTGYPRNDKICAGEINSNPRRVSKIIYMPTFRGVNSSQESNNAINKLLRSSGFKVDELNEFLEKRGAVLTLRLHPSNELDADYIGEISKSAYIKISTSGEDIYDVIDQYDILITDYSSIFFDFMLSGKPVIHAGFDLGEYLINSRALYQSYDSICLTPEISNWSDIMRFIDDVSCRGLSVEYVGRYKLLSSKCNDYHDACSSVRVVKYAMDALNIIS